MTGACVPFHPARAVSRLEAGHVVILWQACPDSLADARRLARSLSGRLESDWAVHRPGHRQALRISRTATRGVAAAAAALGTPVGMDAEFAGPAPDPATMALALHPDEAKAADAAGFHWLWTRKEAVLKALGIGLALDPRSLRTGFRRDVWQAVAPPWGGTVHVRSLDTLGQLPAAVAVLGEARPVSVFALAD